MCMGRRHTYRGGVRVGTFSREGGQSGVCVQTDREPPMWKENTRCRVFLETDGGVSEWCAQAQAQILNHARTCHSLIVPQLNQTKFKILKVLSILANVQKHTLGI